MRILHIANSLLGGGIQNFLLSLMPEQVKQGNEVTLVVIDKYSYDYCDHLESILAGNGVNVVRLNKVVHDKISMLKTIFKCREVVGKIRPDVVNTHGEMSHIYGAFAVLGRNIPQVTTIHNTPEIWPLRCRILCSGKPHIFCSQAAFDMRRQNSGMMATIANGVSPEIVRSHEVVDLRKELSLSCDDKVIVLVGSMRPQKNYEFLKEIVDKAKDPSLHFCVCGGNYGNGYVPASVFKGYENNIHLMGLRSDIAAIENGADMFMSCALFEGLPIAVLEAYFNGIPCVLSPIPQHINISEVEKVWIPKNFEPESFLCSIRKALACDDSHDVIYESRKPQIEKYSISNTSRKYTEFYKEIVK